jgi:hypothetical protein
MNNQNPIERYAGKESEAYRRFASDFWPVRDAAWHSIWLQAMPAVLLPDVRSVLEFGGGRDLTRTIVRHFGIDYLSVDISNQFFPDVVSSIADYRFTGQTYDLVCSFQCLEHNPLEDLDSLLRHMVQFTRKYFYVSVPYSGAWLSLAVSIRLPKFFWRRVFCSTSDTLGARAIDTAPLQRRPPESRHAAHWWEAGRRNLPKRELMRRFERVGLRLVESKHNPLFPHHLFLLFERADSPRDGLPGEKSQ